MRWRDVKQGKSNKKQVNNPLLIFTIAPIAERIKAFIIDAFMILMPLMYLVFYIIIGSREAFATHMLLGWAYIFVPHFFITLVFWYFRAQTPGYKSQNIKIVDTNLQKPSINKLLLRYFVFFVSSLTIFGITTCFFRKDKKNIHDILSRTIPILIED